jgi:hypothetical protein
MAEDDSTPVPVQQTIDEDPELLRAVEQGELQGGSLDCDSEHDEGHNRDKNTLDGRMELDFEQPIPILFDKVPSPDAADLPDDTLAAYKRSLDQQAETDARRSVDNDPLQGLTATELPAEPDESLFSSTELGLDEEIPDTAADSTAAASEASASPAQDRNGLWHGVGRNVDLSPQ